MAALWKLPVLFICENNHYQIGTEIHRHSAVPEVHKRACAYGMEARRVDGMEVQAVYEASRLALEHVRSGLGPYLLECDTYRFRGHSMADSDAYRSSLEMAELRARDPLVLFRRHVEEAGWLSGIALEELEARAQEVVDEAVAFALASPPPGDLYQDVYHRPLDLYRGGHEQA